jgi:hypothetical protein
MKNYKPCILTLGVLLAFAIPTLASTINVTNASQVTIYTDESLSFSISAGDAFATDNESYPSDIQLVLGSLPLSGPQDSIPGTSGVFVSGMLFSGVIESQDGSVWIPLCDPNATRLGLPAGDMLMVAGFRSGGSYSGPIDELSADVTLSSQAAASLFASGEAVLNLHNTGPAVTFGYSGSPITSAFSASLVTHGGTESEGARVLKVEHITAPEPGTIGLLLIGIALIIPRLLRRKQ